MKPTPAPFPQTPGAGAATQKYRRSKGRANFQNLLSGSNSTTRLRCLPRPPAWFARIVVSVIAFIALFAATARAVTPAATAAQLVTLEERVVTQLLTASGSTATERTAWLPTLGSDGLWPLSEINYDDTSRTNWNPQQHLARLDDLAVTCRKAKTNASQVALFTQTREAVIRGLKGWLNRNPFPTSLNWYQNQIAATTVLGRIAVLMKPELTEANGFTAAERDKLLTRLALAWNGGNGGAPATGPNALTGANLVWVSVPTLYRGIYGDNLTDINRAAEGVARAITTIKDGEGILADGSFHQHGALLYNGGYGTGFVQDSLSAATYFQDLATLALESPALTLLEALVLDGNRWMIRGTWFDNSTRGREPGRFDVGPVGSGYANALNRLIALNGTRPGARNPELQAVRARILDASLAPFTGTKVFPRSDYLVQARNSSWLSVRAASSRTVMTETTVNQENITGAYQGDGAMFLRTKGDEYHTILPLWDPTKVPGTTTRQSSTLPTNTYLQKGAQAYSGGAQLDDSIAYGFRYTRNSVTATKGWIVFPDATVFFGADVGVTSSSITDPVATTVNQTYLRGAVTLRERGASSSTVLAKSATPYAYATPPSWVHHDGFGYIFPSSLTTPVEIHPRTVTGRKWTDVNVNSSNTDEITTNNDTLTLAFNHGANPSGGLTTYATIIYPAATADAVQTFAAANPITILAQTATVLAARHATEKITGAVFRGAGATELRSGVSLASDGDATVLVQKTDTAVNVAIADPGQSRTTAQLTLGLLLDGPGATRNLAAGTTTLAFTLPTAADQRGSTVSATFTVFAPATPATPPAAPTQFTATPSAANQISLAWTAPAGGGQTAYNLDFRLSGASAWTSLTNPAAAATSFVHTGLTGGSTYEYRLRATNSAGPSTYANSSATAASGALGTGTSLFGTTTPPTGSSNDSNYELGMRFRVTQRGQVTALRVYRATNGAASYPAKLWRASDQTILASATITGGTPVGWKSVTLATPVTLETGVTYLVSYSIDAGTTYQATNGSFGSTLTNGALTTAGAATDAGYIGVYVTTKGAFPTQSFNNSNYWADVTFSPFLPVPAAPSAFTTTAASASSIQLSWTAGDSTQTGYSLEVSIDGQSTWSVLANPAANTTGYTHTGLSPSVTRAYRLRATNGSGSSGALTASATTWTALEGWRVSQGLAQNGSGTAADTADPDGDGLVNLLEYALNGTPTNAASAPIPIAALVPSTSTLTLSFFRARPASELTYTVQASSDLVTWTDLVTNPGTTGQNVTVTDTPPADAPRRFLRLRVTSP